MTRFNVMWEIDIDADTPREAALKALSIQRDRSSQATVFDVQQYDSETTTTERIDLLDPTA